MKELLYFSSSDLMVQVSYKKDVNSINYFSHRELSFGERVVIEQYLLTNIAIKTEYYKRHPAMLNYSGVNIRLLKELNQFHLKNTMDTMKKKEGKVKDTVKSLIDDSLSNYYFEQIGNLILEIKQAVRREPPDEINSEFFKNRLEELIEAYNNHSEKKVDFFEVIPTDLHNLFESN